MTGCAARVSTGYAVHDGYYNDDHVWDNNEVVYYGRWENETHRHHRDFRKRPDNEQKEYWDWRHGHSDDHHSLADLASGQGHRPPAIQLQEGFCFRTRICASAR
jgi:hypothetical protein